MGSRKQHCEACKRDLGEEWDKVHKWIDELGAVVNEAGVPCLDVNHRWKRHNKESVEEIREMWGDDAAAAAEHHIKMDMGDVYTKQEMIDAYGTQCNPIPWESLFGKQK